MQTADIYQQYKEQALSTLTRGEVVVKLFEEASKQVSIAIFLINGGEDPVRAYNCIAKAQKIISNLNSSLDMKYAISIELNDLYVFLFEKLGEAIVNKDVVLLRKLLTIIDNLKDAFKQADKLAGMQR